MDLAVPRWRLWTGYSILFLLFSGILCLSLLQPLTGDDILNIGTYRNSGSLWSYLKTLYLTFCGRVSTLVILGLGYSSMTWLYGLQAIKTAVFFLTAYLICRISLHRSVTLTGCDLPFFLMVVMGLLFCLHADYTVIWFTGGIVYLFPACAFLLFMEPYRNLIGTSYTKTQFSYWKVLGLFLMGFVVGNGHEQLAASAIFLFAIWMFWVNFNGMSLSQVPIWCWIGLCGLLFGMMVSVVAPGNWQRLRWGYEVVPQAKSLVSVFLGFVLREGFTTPLLCWSVCMVTPVIVFFQHRNSHQREALFMSVGLIVAAFASMFPLLITRKELYFAPSTSFFFAFLIILALSIMFGSVENQVANLLKSRHWILAITMSLVLTIILVKEVRGGFQLWAFYRERAQFVAHQKAENIQDVLVATTEPWLNLSFIRQGENMGTDPQSKANLELAFMYGVKSIAIDSSTKVDGHTQVAVFEDIVNSQRRQMK